MYIVTVNTHTNKHIPDFDALMNPATGKPGGASGRATRLLICFCIIAVNLGIYLQVYSFDVASINEVVAITEYHKGFTVDNLKKAFGGPSVDTAYWAPVVFILFMIDAEIFNSMPGPLHLVNLFLHIGSALLLFIFLRRTTRRSWPSGLVAILFSCHPLNVESVAWIAVHDSSLSTFFLMLSLLAYLNYAQKNSRRQYILMTVFFLLGMMSKSSIVYFPFLLLLLDYWPLNRFSAWKDLFRFNKKNLVAEKIPLIVFILLWVAATWFLYYYSDFSKAETAAKIDLSALSFLPNTPVSYMNYLNKIFYPKGLAPAVLLPPHHFTLSQQIITAVLMTAITGIALFCSHIGCRYWLIGWLWFVVVMAPGVAVTAIKRSLVTDRYAYIGAIGIFIIVVWSADALLSRVRHGKAIAIFSGLAIPLILMPVSFIQTRHWQNTITLVNHAIDLAPGNEYAYRLLGNVLREAGKKADAIETYTRLLSLVSDQAPVYNIIGVIKGEMRDTPGAIEAFSRALTLKPGYTNAYHNLGNVLLDAGKTDDAIACFETALRTDPALYQTHNSLATALAATGRFDKAICHLYEALRINPHYETARENLKWIEITRETAGQGP